MPDQFKGEKMFSLLKFLTEKKNKKDGDPCWPGYHQEGMKMKDGKQVPNCVPNKKD